MVEIARLEEAGGGTLKHYKSNTRVFSYEFPETARETLGPAQETTSEELQALVETLYAEHSGEIESVANRMKPCEYCETQFFEEFIVRKLLDTALLTLGEPGSAGERRTDSE
jgi:hypothetical protein